MNQQDEKLSALLDDDAEADINVVIDEVMADVNLQYRVRRYQMIGETLRHELPQAIDTDFHHNVMARIREEAPAVESAGSQRDKTSIATLPLTARSWFRPFAGLAVAASVALVTVALWQQDPLLDDGLVSADQQKIQQLADQQVGAGAVQASSRVQTNGTRWKLENESPVLQRKLNSYLVNHTEYSNSMQGLIPQARVAGFDAQQ